jgi:hypothetical protein
MRVSLFKSCFDTSPLINKDVGYFLDRIRNGKHCELVAQIRATTEKEKRTQLKQTLPIVLFAGVFTKRSKKEFKSPSGLMVLDFDNLPNIQEKKKELISLPYIFSCWVSPSGDGLKALVKISNVQNDEEYKRYFNQLFKEIDGIDKSGSDISRACYESYDPEIYINLDCETYFLNIKDNAIEETIQGQLTNLPLLDGDVIANRLIKWFKSKYDSNNRNSSLFKLAVAFNDFGVDKLTALRYLNTFEQKDFTQREIDQITNSAYKNTSNFGTKFFEDNEKKKRLTNLVLGGKSFKEIQKDFKGIEESKLNQEVELIKKTINIDEFWTFNNKGQIEISPYRFKIYLENMSYYKYYPIANKNTFLFITKKGNFINQVNEYLIKDVVMDNLKIRNQIDVFDVVAEKTKIFTNQYLSMIDTANIEVEKDTQDYAMIYYKNYVLQVKKKELKLYNYEDINNHIWENQIIDREFIEADHHESMFRSFVWYIAGEETERYNTMKSILGYLLHSYKNSSNNKAIILNDETISEHPNGGSGKGILINAIGHMKKVSTIDGKSFDFNKSFPYQTVSTDCQVLAFDDVKKNFNFESLFSLITEGLTIEYKGKDAIKLPVKDSPKILISTNYTIKSEGGSFERRMFEVELSSYFNANNTPFDKFECMLFDDWDDLEWARFDQYMINCLQFYLQNGLVKSAPKNLKTRKFINQTCQEFFEFVNDDAIPINKRINRNDYHTKFIEEYKDFGKWLTQRAFNKWINSYCEYLDIDLKQGVSNGIRWVSIGETKNEDEQDTPF